MIVLGLFIFVLLIVAHEYGHFLAAKRNGVEVEEFGIGFPPKLFGKTMGKGIFRGYYTINLIPLGGFVRLKGENSEDKRPGSFGATTFWAKTKIILAGVFMNIVLAWALFTVAAMVELPRFLPNQFTIESATTITEQNVDIVTVAEDSPAAAANIPDNVTLLSVAQEPIKTLDDVDRVVEQNAGQTVDVSYRSVEAADEAEPTTVPVDLRANPDDGESYLGVGLISNEKSRVSPWAAPLVAVGLVGQTLGQTLQFLGDLVMSPFQGDFDATSQGVTGPVGLVFGIFPAVESIWSLLVLGGVISISLAVINSLPLPALDGGRLAVTGLFKLLKKPLSATTENAIHGSGMAFFLLLAILITYMDVVRL